ncbi:MAG: ribonuclease HII [Candidatus Omnitrophica bacterium]|nr:ribonuclease HII [Candidatus Omnitrophota bacterium]
MLSYENKAKKNGFQTIIGIDEAGRGPLAGPVVACAVLLKNHDFESTIRDSKKMTPKQRQIACREILEKSHVGIGLSDAKLIDHINILKATFHAMTLAVEDLLSKLPMANISKEQLEKQTCLFVDGNAFKTHLPFKYQTIVKGDSLSLSIACASIVAKVTRDHMMENYDTAFSGYGFKVHKGYPTAFHKGKIKELGLSPIHRKTFKYW